MLIASLVLLRDLVEIPDILEPVQVSSE